jgi:hypothetical protein
VAPFCRRLALLVRLIFFSIGLALAKSYQLPGPLQPGCRTRPKVAANRFTKVKMDVKADVVFRHYFAAHTKKIESWFNIITPNGQSLKKLQEELKTLNGKDWTKMLST